MSSLPTIQFTKKTPAASRTLVFLVPEKGKLPPSAAPWNKDKRLSDAMKIAGFEGKLAKRVEIVAPGGKLDRILLVGIGKASDKDEDSWMKVGGVIMAASGKSRQITIQSDLASNKPGSVAPEALAALAAGAKLRAYVFDVHKTVDKKASPVVKISLVTDKLVQAKKAWSAMDGISDGVVFARNLVNEPANILGPVEFARQAVSLKKLGCQVEILDEKKLKSEKMGALLGVAQGSVRPPRVAIMHWKGGNANSKPVAFVGKGVVFDTGGISMKPAGGMEDMKGDMGGAAAVCGVMHALAARKAKVNAIGIIGLVENMPDGNAQRPGDIVTSRSGQTIEVLNTDAEGRLVLADLLDYTEKKYKPQFMVNLATLTGAVIVALGNHHAGLFSNDDKLAGQLTTAGTDTSELLWRLPLAEAYDKLIDSKNADMKNIGGRMAGSITAAQFLQRFVKNTPWAHLDIAGTAMGSPKSEYSQGWASGFGVRLLDRLVANAYEGK